MLRVGLTGGIGAGKSTVSGRLAELGAVVIDADQLAREVVEPGRPALAEIVEEFGQEVLAPDGGLDRPVLGRIVFGDPGRRAILNAIVHPQVARLRADRVATAPADAVVVEDIPLLVENGLADSFPLVLVVHAHAELRTQRLIRRGHSRQEAQERIEAQADDEERRAAADVWLDNTGSVDDLLERVDRLWGERLVPYERHLRTRRCAPRIAQPDIADPDPAWSAQAARLIRKLQSVVGDRAGRIDHIGSTAVPGLPAKDVIDLQVVVRAGEEPASVAGDVIEAGFVQLSDRWFDVGRDGSEYDKELACNADPARPVNIHVRPVESPVWRDTLLLRDWLRASSAEAEAYAAMKRALAERTFVMMDHYAAEKTPWINAALARADVWADQTGRPDLTGRSD